MLHRLISLLGIGILCGAFGPAPAVAWDYQGAAIGGWRQLSERAGDGQLVSETGPVAGVEGALTTASGGWRFGVDGAFWGGLLDYDGATQLGADFETDTEWTGWLAGARVERRTLLPVPLLLGGRIEYEWRQRRIRSTPAVQGLDEQYGTLWLGIHGSFQPTSFSTVGLDAACAAVSDVEVRFDERFDTTTLPLDDHCRIGVAARFDVGRWGSKMLFVKPFGNWERYPRSDSAGLTANGLRVGSIYLPETEITTFGITIGVRELDD
jgi:hypothetical protein